MRLFLIKAVATALTIGATAASAVFVTTHLKNPAAPLQPAVLNAGSGSTTTTLDGTLTVGPSVQASNAAPMTSTYASSTYGRVASLGGSRPQLQPVRRRPT